MFVGKIVLLIIKSHLNKCLFKNFEKKKKQLKINTIQPKHLCRISINKKISMLIQKRSVLVIKLMKNSKIRIVSRKVHKLR